MVPLVTARSVLPKCFPRQTSFPGICAHSNHGSSAGSQPEVCGKTCTAQLACTENKKGHGISYVKLTFQDTLLTQNFQPPTCGSPI